MGTVSQWTMRFILARPDSPSRDISWRLGTTGVRSCMTMEAVMYGKTPRATMLMRRNAPPLKRSKKPRSWLSSTRRPTWPGSMPGIEMWAMNRYRASMARVNSILALRSGMLKASMAAWSSLGNLPPWVSVAIIGAKAPPPSHLPPQFSPGRCG